jgi:tRNA pseudouridine-54 N-methylase
VTQDRSSTDRLIERATFRAFLTPENFIHSEMKKLGCATKAVPGYELGVFILTSDISLTTENVRNVLRKMMTGPKASRLSLGPLPYLSSICMKTGRSFREGSRAYFWQQAQ